METFDAIDLGREAILTGLLLSAPVLGAGLLVGFIVSLVQAVTQVQEQSLSFVAKMVAVVLVLAISLPWLLDYASHYTIELIQNIPDMLQGG